MYFGCWEPPFRGGMSCSRIRACGVDFIDLRRAFSFLLLLAQKFIVIIPSRPQVTFGPRFPPGYMSTFCQKAPWPITAK
jgi:hypothetical protein